MLSEIVTAVEAHLQETYTVTKLAFCQCLIIEFDPTIVYLDFLDDGRVLIHYRDQSPLYPGIPSEIALGSTHLADPDCFQVIETLIGQHRDGFSSSLT